MLKWEDSKRKCSPLESLDIETDLKDLLNPYGYNFGVRQNRLPKELLGKVHTRMNTDLLSEKE